MQAITFNQAMQNFTVFMDKVSDNHEPLIITHENHKAVVLVSLEDFNAWQETDKQILKRKKSLKHHATRTTD